MPEIRFQTLMAIHTHLRTQGTGTTPQQAVSAWLDEIEAAVAPRAREIAKEPQANTSPNESPKNTEAA